ncbi:Drug/Metabolite Transporter (DMT) Superfamily [Achlya hypogyna]|uniref:Drug/Metabolite Transporter (DMT) Superfamily n=1 Tax=Achlya hypogyna TaxID=1202772 RepID=A0A1V9YMN8_ACHHY|nr:Drug/Metabolite Transporter (DMT) Superfamily [Achlya hypogyna]
MVAERQPKDTPTDEAESMVAHRCIVYKYECLCQCFRLPAAPAPASGSLFVFYSLGLVVCFGLYAYLLERLTIDGKGPNEFVLMFVSCVIYAGVSYAGRVLGRERIDTAPWHVFLLLSFTTFCSSYLSVLALRYVSYIFRVLGKTCKPIPIMAIGLALGKKYPPRKYVSVALVTVGAIIFFVFMQRRHPDAPAHDAALGALLVLISLGFDGATGALEEKFMTQYQMGPFTMMHRINCFSVVLAVLFFALSADATTRDDLPRHAALLPNLIVLGITGGCGQMFIFLMISRFGALMTSMAGTARKILTMAVSIWVFGHVLAPLQYVGLLIAVVGMLANLYRGPSAAKQPPEELSRTVAAEDDEDEDARLLAADAGDDAKLELMNVGAPTSHVFAVVNENLTPKPEAPYGMAIDIAFRATTAV